MIQATRRVSETTQALNFDETLAMKIAGQLFEGVEHFGLKHKANEVLAALLQRRLNITAELIAAYHSGRTAVEQEHAPTQEVSETALLEARAHVAASQETLQCERASLYTAIFIASGVDEAELSFEAAQAVALEAEAEAKAAEEQLATAKKRLAEQQAELKRQLSDYDDRNAVIVAFLAWSAQQKLTLEHEIAESRRPKYDSYRSGRHRW